MRNVIFTLCLLYANTLWSQDDFKLNTIARKGVGAIGGYGTVVNEVTTVAKGGQYS
jgi:hypothetical protein